jgi:hypothetical protein
LQKNASRGLFFILKKLILVLAKSKSTVKTKRAEKQMPKATTPAVPVNSQRQQSTSTVNINSQNQTC